jgi:hypothetical protein
VSRDVLVLVSGLHGSEVLAASASQRLFLREILPGLDRHDWGILLAHGVNSWGCRHGRRATRDNVDLNRNGLSTEEFLKRPDSLYAAFDFLLNPKTPVGAAAFQNTRFVLRMAEFVFSPNRDKIAAALAGGQWSFPDGIFFGGHAFDPSLSALVELISRRATEARRLMVLDLHTGLGRRGKMSVFPHARLLADQRRAVDVLFRGPDVVVAQTEGAPYLTRGSWLSLLEPLLSPRGVEVTPATVEWGTIGTRTLAGKIRVLLTLVRENQLWHFGAKNNRVLARTRQAFQETFCPREARWRRDVLEETRHWLPLFLTRWRLARMK